MLSTMHVSASSILTAALAFDSVVFVKAQFPAEPTGLSVLKSQIREGAYISYKQV